MAPSNIYHGKKNVAPLFHSSKNAPNVYLWQYVIAFLFSIEPSKIIIIILAYQNQKMKSQESQQSTSLLRR